MSKNKIFVLFALLALVLSLFGSVMADTEKDVLTDPNATASELMDAVNGVGGSQVVVTTSNNEIAEAILQSTAIASNTASIIVSSILSVVLLVAEYFIFQKAGYKGWYAIIPVFSAYILFKLAWNKKAFWRDVIYSCGLCVIPVALVLAGDSLQSDFLIIAAAIMFAALMVANIVMSVKLYLRLAKSFGQEKLFALGLIFINTIFMCVLGFDKKIVYVGKAPGPDFVIGKDEELSLIHI